MIKIRDYLAENRIIDLKATTKIDALEELIEGIGSDNAIADREKFFKAVVTREKVMSTGVGDGIAIPHARISQVKNPFVALGRAKQGIEYGSSDGKPVNLVILIGASEKQTSLYLQLLSRTLSLFVDSAMRAKILKAASPREIRETLTATESD